jgi:subfamily B ATP-binding cassette protein MsbA
MFELLRLMLREKKWVALSFVCTLFVAFFTSMYVYLVQPLFDDLLQLAPSSPAALVAPSPVQAGAPGALGSAPKEPTAPKKRVFYVFWDLLGLSRSDIRRALPFAVVIVFFGKGLFTFFSSFFMKAVGNKVVKTMRDRLYEHILYQSSAYFDRAKTGDLMSRLTNDVDRIQQAVSTSMSDLIEESLILVGLLVAMFLIDWRLALISFIVLPLAVVPLAAFSRKLKKRGRQSQAKMAEMYGLIHEAISGQKVVKAFTMERFEIRKFLQASQRYFRINLRLAWISALSSPFMEIIGAVVGAFLLYLGSSRIGKSQMSPGDFGAFIVAIFNMFTPIKRLSLANNVVQQATACLDRIQEVLALPPQIQDAPTAYPLPPVEGRVRFEHVGFAYDLDRPVLFDVDFEALPRQTVALVGLSGAGKTTIINLVARFYECGSGRITVDDHDIRNVTLASLRSQIGLVTQEIILFNDSVRNNIAYGQEGIAEEKVVAAARMAECHDFITDLPQGYETSIGERGMLLSVGQRQRLALARALLKNPPILVLDEATSALDSESERLIQQALDHILKNRTTFVIAHRLSTIRNADKILVVDNGRIVESGSHEDLIKSEGIYRKLHDLQFPEVEETA